jgi:hypothetical protein
VHTKKKLCEVIGKQNQQFIRFDFFAAEEFSVLLFIEKDAVHSYQIFDIAISGVLFGTTTNFSEQNDSL